MTLLEREIMFLILGFFKNVSHYLVIRSSVNTLLILDS